MLAARIGATAMLPILVACAAEDRQFTVVPVPAGTIVGQQPVATSQPIVLYPAHPGLGQGSVIYTQPQVTYVDPVYGYGGSVARAPDVLVEPLGDLPGLGQPPTGPWVLPD
jgi:hypothetical protein